MQRMSCESCLFASAPSKVNKHRKWPLCRETHGFCIIYNCNRPDDALMVSPYEVFGNTADCNGGRCTKAWKPWEKAGVSGEVLMRRNGLRFNLEVGRRGFPVVWGLFVRSFLRLSHPILKSAMPRLCSIKPPLYMHSSHIPARVLVLRNVLARRHSHKSSDISGPPAEAVLWLSSASALEANRCFD